MRIQNNISALNSHRQYSINNANTAKNVEKLSSGYRINRAGDDAAGLAISEKMRGQIRGMNMASKNTQDGISLIQTAEGALQSLHSITQRMRELAVQSGNDTNMSDVDRDAMDIEYQQLKAEIDQTVDKTQFNKRTLINGDLADKTKTGYDIYTVKNKDATVVTSDAKSLITNVNAKGAVAATTVTVAVGVSAAKATLSTAVLNDNSSVIALAGSESLEFEGKSFTINFDNQGATGGFIVTGKDSSGNPTYIAANAANKAAEFAKLLRADESINSRFTIDTTGNKITMTEKVAGSQGIATAAAGAGLLNLNVAAATGSTDATEKSTDTAGVSATYTVSDGAGGSYDYATGKLTTVDGTTITVDKNKLDAAVMADNVAAGGGNTNITAAAGTATIASQTVDAVKKGDTSGPLTFQVGANEGDELSVSVARMGTDVIGRYQATAEGSASFYSDGTPVNGAPKMSGKTEDIKENQVAPSGTVVGTKVASAGPQALADTNILTRENASAAISVADGAIEMIAMQRAALGAVQNRLEFKQANLDTGAENLQAAEGRIRDVDMAKEMSNFTKNNVLAQASTAMLAQANSLPQMVLQLLG